MTEKSASVLWSGAGKKGLGKISTESGALMDYPYGFASRFGDDRRGTNPEEILGAAHAACFTMALSLALNEAGFTAESLETSAKISLEKLDTGFSVTASALTLTAKVPGIDDATFQKVAAGAKANCPISKLLKADISLDAKLS